MPGSDWDRMVAAPSEAELASALAEVRVRAIGHSVRQGKRRRLISGLALLVVAAAGAYAGRATVGLGAIARRAGAPSSPNLLPMPASSPYVPGPVQRFHITNWSELDGVRMNEAEGWVEGPLGTFFTLRGSLGERSFAGTVSANTYGDTTVLNVQMYTRSVLDKPRPAAELIQEVRTGRVVRLVRGQGAVLYPFGLRGQGDEPVSMIRLEGPYAPEPAASVRWQLPDTSGGRQNSGVSPWLKEARAHGVRVARSGFGALSITVGYSQPPMRFRFTLGALSPSVAVVPQSPPFAIPGVSDSVRLWTHRDRFGNLCFQVFPARGGRNAFLAEGCWPNDATTGFTRLAVTTAQGQRLTVEAIAP